MTGRGSAFTRFFSANGSGFVIVLVLAAALTLSTNTFLTGTNLDSLGRQVSIYAIIAVGELLVILTGGIDLSVGSVVGLTGIIVAQMVYGVVGVGGIWLGVLVALASGVVCGIITGTLVSFLGIPPFIASLGMMQVARGGALLFSGGRTIQPLPKSFETIAGGTVLGIPNLVLFTLLVVVVAALALSKTTWGRYVHAVGSNAESARLSGVPVKKVLISVYAASGLLAAFGGVLLASRLNNGVPTAGDGYELQAIAACVIGGASLFGARGTAVGSLIGALIVGMLNNGGSLLGVDPFWLKIAIGVLILAAVASDQVSTWLPGLRRALGRRGSSPGGGSTAAVSSDRVETAVEPS